jgi:integrase
VEPIVTLRYRKLRYQSMPRRPVCPRQLIPVRLDFAVAQFMEYVRGAVAADSGTAATKAVVVRALLERFDGSREVWTLTSGDLQDTLTWVIRGASPEEAEERRRTGRKPRTGRKTQGSVSQARTVLRQFAEYCRLHLWIAEGVTIHKEIVRGVKSDLRAEETSYVRIPPADWEMVLVKAEHIHMRCRMAVALGLYCGRRISESVRLQWKNIDWQEEVISFYNKKRGHWFAVPLHPDIRREIEYWCAWAIQAGYGPPQDDWYLVANRVDSRYITGPNSRARLRLNPSLWRLDMTKPSSTGTIWKDVRKLLNELGLGAKEGTHTFRRSSAKAIAKTSGLRAAQALLDHKTVVTTQGYTGNEDGYEQLVETLMDSTGFHPPTRPRAEPEPLPDNVRPLRRVS